MPRKTDKPVAVTEVEASAPSAIDDAWERLASSEPVSDADLPLIVEAARAARQKWILAQSKRGRA